MSSLSIMPQRMGYYYDDFIFMANLYWREKDFPERVYDYFLNSLFSPNDPLYEEKRHYYALNACQFAVNITAVRYIPELVDSLLDWGSIFSKSEYLKKGYIEFPNDPEEIEKRRKYYKKTIPICEELLDILINREKRHINENSLKLLLKKSN